MRFWLAVTGLAMTVRSRRKEASCSPRPNTPESPTNLLIMKNRTDGDSSMGRRKFLQLSAAAVSAVSTVEKILYLQPSVSGDFRCFLSTATGYGTVGVKNGKPFFESKSGHVEIREIKYVRTT